MANEVFGITQNAASKIEAAASALAKKLKEKAERDRQALDAKISNYATGAESRRKLVTIHKEYSEIVMAYANLFNELGQKMRSVMRYYSSIDTEVASGSLSSLENNWHKKHSEISGKS